jgi:hypothetical protein
MFYVLSARSEETNPDKQRRGERAEVTSPKGNVSSERSPIVFPEGEAFSERSELLFPGRETRDRLLSASRIAAWRTNLRGAMPISYSYTIAAERHLADAVHLWDPWDA